MILNKLKYTFSGWTGALILLIIYLASEFGTVALGGDFGAFMYVTLHFIVNPLLSVLVIVAISMMAVNVQAEDGPLLGIDIDSTFVTNYMWREGVLLRERSLLYAISGDDRDIPKIVEILEERFFCDWELKNYDQFNALAIPLDFESQVNYWMFWR